MQRHDARDQRGGRGAVIAGLSDGRGLSALHQLGTSLRLRAPVRCFVQLFVVFLALSKSNYHCLPNPCVHVSVLNRGSERIAADDQLWVAVNNTGEDQAEKDQVIVHSAWWGELPQQAPPSAASAGASGQ